MLCPVCNVTLAISDRNGVEIDYCPKCRGVWLDRGELDKIIERNSMSNSNHSTHFSNHSYQNNTNYKKKKESWLGELFDF